MEWWHWKRERPESQNTLVNVFSAKFALSPRLMLGFLRQSRVARICTTDQKLKFALECFRFDIFIWCNAMHLSQKVKLPHLKP